MAAPLRILLSKQVLPELEADIGRLMVGRAHELVSMESALETGRTDLDLAFISRDVTGRSTKHEPSDALQARYAILRRSPSLQWVHIHSAGADRPVYVELHARGVAVTTSSGVNAEVVAQTAIAGLLALARRFPQLMAAQQARTWAPLLGDRTPRDLQGQTVVVVGWGPIGQRIASVLSLLGMKIIAVRHRPMASLDERDRASGVEMAVFDALPSLAARCDWLVLACPLTERTQGLVDRRLIAALPKGAGIVNVSRGEVVVESDLIAALQSGHLGSAFLDVFEHEPLDSASPLWHLPHVLLTPHSAGHADGNHKRVVKLFLDNLRRWRDGDVRANRVV
jgi:phosphoglycerate dehydrogenase-like enzyme